MSTPTLTEDAKRTRRPVPRRLPWRHRRAANPALRPGPGSTPAAKLRRRALQAGKAVWGAGAIILFLLLWELGPTYLAPASTRVFLPPLHVVLEALGALIANGQLQNHLAASLTRSASGFGIAVRDGRGPGTAGRLVRGP